MGLTESRIISGKLTVACFEADSQGRHGIHNLLDDDEFISNLRTLWKQIPLSQKRRIQSVGTTSKKAPAKLEQSVSESLIKSTPQWKKDPQSFFSEGGTVQLGLQYPVAESYNFVLQLEERGEKNTWRIRFLKIVFSRLLAKVCSGYRRTKDIKRAITIIQASGIVGHNAKLIEEHILSWSDIGRRLESLCEDLFYGYKGDPTGDGDVDRRARGRDEKHLCMLFCLPHFVNQDYLKKLPFSGPNRTQKLKILEEIGAVTGGQDSSLGQLACDIFKFLWDPVQQSLVREDFIQQIPPGQSTYDTPSRGNGTQRSTSQSASPLRPSEIHSEMRSDADVGLQHAPQRLTDLHFREQPAGQPLDGQDSVEIATGGDALDLQHRRDHQIPGDLQPHIPQQPSLHRRPLQTCPVSMQHTFNLQPFIRQPPSYTAHHDFNRQNSIEHAMAPESGQSIQEQMNTDQSTLDLRPYIQQAPGHANQNSLHLLASAQHAVTFHPDQRCQTPMDIDQGTFNLQPYIQQAPGHANRNSLDQPVSTQHAGTFISNQSCQAQMDINGRHDHTAQDSLHQSVSSQHAVTFHPDESYQTQMDIGQDAFNLQPYIQQAPGHANRNSLDQPVSTQHAETFISDQSCQAQMDINRGYDQANQDSLGQPGSSQHAVTFGPDQSCQTDVQQDIFNLRSYAQQTPSDSVQAPLDQSHGFQNDVLHSSENWSRDERVVDTQTPSVFHGHIMGLESRKLASNLFNAPETQVQSERLLTLRGMAPSRSLNYRAAFSTVRAGG